jgi:hypothetical protein
MNSYRSRLESQRIPKWRKFYLNYSHLSDLLSKCIELFNEANPVDISLLNGASNAVALNITKPVVQSKAIEEEPLEPNPLLSPAGKSLRMSPILNKSTSLSKRATFKPESIENLLSKPLLSDKPDHEGSISIKPRDNNGNSSNSERKSIAFIPNSTANSLPKMPPILSSDLSSSLNASNDEEFDSFNINQQTIRNASDYLARKSHAYELISPFMMIRRKTEIERANKQAEAEKIAAQNLNNANNNGTNGRSRRNSLENEAKANLSNSSLSSSPSLASSNRNSPALRTISTPLLKPAQRRLSLDNYVDGFNAAQLLFLAFFESELVRVNEFYCGRVAHLAEQLAVLISQTARIDKEILHHDLDIEEESSDLCMDSRAAESLKQAYQDCYRSIQMLEGYATLNHAGFTKLIKKYDKFVGRATGAAGNMTETSQTEDNNGADEALLGLSHSAESENLREKYLTIMKELDIVNQNNLNGTKEEIERNFAKFFCDDNIPAGRAILMSKIKARNDWNMYNLGLKGGIMLILLVWTIWDCVIDAHIRPPRHSAWVSAVLPIYRGLGCLILLNWLWGINLFVWNKFKINYLFLLELDPRYTKNYSEMFNQATTMTIVALANFLLFFKTLRGDTPDWISSGYMPMVLLGYVLYMIMPWPWNRSNQFSRGVLKVLASPFYEVTFFTSYIGDIMTSMVKVFIDLAYTLCFAFSGYWQHELQDDFTNGCTNSNFYTLFVVPFLSALPLWLRFLQCLRRYRDTHERHPNLSNAGKYACAVVVVLFGAFHNFTTLNNNNPYKWLWIIFFIVATLYAYTWDVTMDWGLGRPAFKYLRERKMLEGRDYLYYIAIVEDFVLRFAWTLTLIPTSGSSDLFGADFTYYLTPALAIVELCRRAAWAIFRVENEHLYNTEHFYSYIPNFTAHHNRKSPQQAPGWHLFAEVSVLIIIVISLGLVAAFT